MKFKKIYEILIKIKCYILIKCDIKKLVKKNMEKNLIFLKFLKNIMKIRICIKKKVYIIMGCNKKWCIWLKKGCVHNKSH